MRTSPLEAERLTPHFTLPVSLRCPHRICTSLQKGNRILQPVFHSSKEGWRDASHFRSSSSERIRHVSFETNRVTDQIRGLVCHDRSQGRILSHNHPSVSQEVAEVRFWGKSIPVSGSSIRPSIITPHFHEMRRCSPGASLASGYSHYDLHRQLVVSSSVASFGSSASRCRSCPHKKTGVTAKRQEKCAFSTTEDHFPGRDVGLNVDAGTPVTGTYRVHSIGCEKNKARPVTHCQTVSETVRSYGSSIQRDTCWTVAHETPAVVAQDQRVFPEGQPLSHDQGHVAMPLCLGNVEESLVPVPGSHVGSFMSSQDANDRCLPHGLASDLRGTLESLEGPSSLMAHQPPGDVGCMSCSQDFPSRSQGPPCACPLRQHIGGLLHKSPGGFAVTSTLQNGVPNPPVVPVVVSASNLHAWNPQYRSRHPVETGAEARGMEAPPRGGGADMEGVWSGTSGSVCISRDVSLPTLVLPHASSTSRTGCDDTDVAEASSVCISPDRSAPGSTGESSPGPSPTTSYCPTVAGQSMVPKSIIPSRRASSGAPRQEGPSVPSVGLDISPPSRTMETVGLASEGA